MVIGLSLIITSFVVLHFSPGEVKPFFDEKGEIIIGSVSEKIKVEINGVEQGMIIRGQNENKPVLLFVHGGPGMPEYFLSEKYETQ